MLRSQRCSDFWISNVKILELLHVQYKYQLSNVSLWTKYCFEFWVKIMWPINKKNCNTTCTRYMYLTGQWHIFDICLIFSWMKITEVRQDGHLKNKIILISVVKGTCMKVHVCQNSCWMRFLWQHMICWTSIWKC